MLRPQEAGTAGSHATADNEQRTPAISPTQPLGPEAVTAGQEQPKSDWEGRARAEYAQERLAPCSQRRDQTRNTEEHLTAHNKRGTVP